MNTNALKSFARDTRTKLLALLGKKIEFVLTQDTAELRGKQEQIGKLCREVERHGKDQVVERIAYVWFNRFMALRFMDANEYNSPKVVSPVAGGTIPEILQEAKAGHFDDSLQINPQRINDLLDGRTPSVDPQADAYKLLIVASCNSLNAVMPFMFERIADFTELLIPDDLLSDYSIVTDIRNGMSDKDCKQVEIIGWMYQFYISEKKDKVFEDLAKNKKITPEDIPAATQIFTPNWIVRYLVENSLGRLWMLNRPRSRLIEKMQYYINPEQAEADFLKVSSPEEIKLCDPACGSGHMLVYAFTLLYLIYEEEGYEPTEIPRKILANNLYGIEIDERAGELAAFALTMVARDKYRRLFNKPVQPNICVLEKIHLTSVKDPKSVTNDLFTNVKWEDKGWENILVEICKDGIRRKDLLHDLGLFVHSDTLGSLVKPSLSPTQLKRAIDTATILHKNNSDDAFVGSLTLSAFTILQQAEYLSKRYHVVVANPPYMSSAGFNERLKTYAEECYPDSKSDTYAMFIERSLALVATNGMVGMITIPNWMFLTSFAKLRHMLFADATVLSLVENGRGVWGSDFGSCSFIIKNARTADGQGVYVRLYNKQGSVASNDILQKRFHDRSSYPLYFANQEDFRKLPGAPLAYWVSKAFLDLAGASPKLGDLCPVKEGLNTGDNARFLRYWYEVGLGTIGFDTKDRNDAKSSGHKWFPCNKGGAGRRWYGNNEYVINWLNDGYEIRHLVDSTGYLISRPQNLEYYFLEGITWSGVSIALFSGRYFPPGHIFNSAGRSLLPKKEDVGHFLGLLNSKVGIYYFQIVAPTPSFTVGNVASFPVALINPDTKSSISERVLRAIEIAKTDWNQFEDSWDFKANPLVTPVLSNRPIADSYASLSDLWRASTNELMAIEEYVNRRFIEAYGLQNELSPEVRMEEITLTCNSNARYSGDRKGDDVESLQRSGVARDLVSYFVGCVFGRYSLDRPGLILANPGGSLTDYAKLIPNPVFEPVEDNIVPIQDNEYFTGDLVERFKEFLRVSFGLENYDRNIEFIEKALDKDIRRYFVTAFFRDHIKRYKKRPIYWMFSSPNRSFNVLIYLHRYRPDTISTILNDYLRVFIDKLVTKKSALTTIAISESASAREKTRATKEIDSIEAKLKELKAYEKTLHDYAARKIEIDLDDGVKVNYLKFKEILAPIPGLDKDEE